MGKVTWHETAAMSLWDQEARRSMVKHIREDCQWLWGRLMFVSGPLNATLSREYARFEAARVELLTRGEAKVSSYHFLVISIHER